MSDETPRSSRQLTNENVAEFVRLKIYTLMDVSGLQRYSSNYWAYFRKVVDGRGDLIDFAYCEECKEALRLYGAGTTTLIRHIKMRKCTNQFAEEIDSTHNRTKRLPDLLSANSIPNKRAKMVEAANEAVERDFVKLAKKQQTDLKDRVTDQLVKWVAHDLRPFCIASGVQFNDLAQLFINIGATNGLIDANTIIPSDRTISNRVTKIYADLLKKVMPEVKEAISEGTVQIDKIVIYIFNDQSLNL